MSNALTVYNQFDTMQRTAIALHESGYFSDSKNKAQAIVKVMAGAELGIPPFASMTGIHIIQGKPALGANVIATLIKNDSRYNYKVVTLDDSTCEIEFYEGGELCGVSIFTAQDARKAQVKNMDKFPRNMLFARAISNGAKWFTPGIFGGNPVYTPDELGADVDEDGNVVEGEIVQVQPPKPRQPVAATQPASPPPPDPSGWDDLPSASQPAAPKAKDNGVTDDNVKPTPEMMKALHAAGSAFYGSDWDTRRGEIVKAVTKGRTSSSKQITRAECKTLLDGISAKANAVA